MERIDLRKPHEVEKLKNNKLFLRFRQYFDQFFNANKDKNNSLDHSGDDIKWDIATYRCNYFETQEKYFHSS